MRCFWAIGSPQQRRRSVSRWTTIGLSACIAALGLIAAPIASASRPTSQAAGGQRRVGFLVVPLTGIPLGFGVAGHVGGENLTFEAGTAHCGSIIVGYSCRDTQQLSNAGLALLSVWLHPWSTNHLDGTVEIRPKATTRVGLAWGQDLDNTTAFQDSLLWLLHVAAGAGIDVALRVHGAAWAIVDFRVGGLWLLQRSSFTRIGLDVSVGFGVAARF